MHYQHFLLHGPMAILDAPHIPLHHTKSPPQNYSKHTFKSIHVYFLCFVFSKFHHYQVSNHPELWFEEMLLFALDIQPCLFIPIRGLQLVLFFHAFWVVFKTQKCLVCEVLNLTKPWFRKMWGIKNQEHWLLNHPNPSTTAPNRDKFPTQSRS